MKRTILMVSYTSSSFSPINKSFIFSPSIFLNPKSHFPLKLTGFYQLVTFMCSEIAVNIVGVLCFMASFSPLKALTSSNCYYEVIALSQLIQNRRKMVQQMLWQLRKHMLPLCCSHVVWAFVPLSLGWTWVHNGSNISLFLDYTIRFQNISCSA